jgi:UDP-N-acetylglucosamine 2-epimerase (non-hydrolysing)
MKIMSVVGARPNFMKIAPIISAIGDHNKIVEQRKSVKPDPRTQQHIQHVLVHTGQHYDKQMSESFFKDLGIPKPDVYLSVGSASHAVQTANIMKKFEKVLLDEKPDVIIVVGDVNSTIACSLVASKILYASHSNHTAKKPLICHVEAGLRSSDRMMPEEINRILTDHLSDILFVTEESGIKNLTKEGISTDKIYFVGNTMIDTLSKFRKKAQQSDILLKLGIIKRNKKTVSKIPYTLLTLHRPSNVDNKKIFSNIIDALMEISKQFPLIFPAHPRTLKQIIKFDMCKYFNQVSMQKKKEGSGELNAEHLLEGKINIIDPLGYIDFLSLMQNARIVLTDSGGIQEETTCLGVPCLTIRTNTERPVTIVRGTNILAGIDKSNIINAFHKQLDRKFTNNIPQHWDGKTAKRIFKIIKAFL